MTDDRFIELFSRDAHVVFAFHGYPGAVHQLLHGRPEAPRFHVRGYREEGTTTTPFDMVVLNETSRFHLASRRSKRRAARSQRRRAHRRMSGSCSNAIAPTSASTSRTCPRFATGTGRQRKWPSNPVILCVNGGSSSLKVALYQLTTGNEIKLAQEVVDGTGRRLETPGHSRRARGASLPHA